MNAMEPINPRSYEHLSPFEIKDELIRLARTSGQATAHVFLNAGRGNPNWIAARARQIFFTLGHFALDEATRVMAHPAGIAGMPRAAGIADRLRTWLGDRKDAGTGALLQDAAERFGFQSDAFIHELVDAIIGDNYPVPDRMLVHAEQVVHEYLIQAMCGMPRPSGRFDLFATEGGTAAICYIFRSLKANRLLKPGDRIALGTPIFTPYWRYRNSRIMALSRSMSMRRRKMASSSPIPSWPSWRIPGSRHSSWSTPEIRPPSQLVPQSGPASQTSCGRDDPT